MTQAEVVEVLLPFVTFADFLPPTLTYNLMQFLELA